MARVRAIMFRATFKNISAISWWSVLLVGETEVPGENHRPFPSDLKYFAIGGFELITLVVIGTDCTGSCKSNYHTITTMTDP
jgi:hypothetical protein